MVPRLMLNAGLRYEYNSPPVETHNRFSVPDLSCQLTDLLSHARLPVHPGGHQRRSAGHLRPHLTNFAPRLGVAWRPMKTERWVVRSAYGIFYDVGIFNINIFPRANPPFLRAVASIPTAARTSSRTSSASPGMRWSRPT